MKIFESTTLADYLAAEWVNLDPDVLRLLERTQAYIDELEEGESDWKANYDDAHETCRQLIADVSDVIYDLKTVSMSTDEVIRNLQDALDGAEIGGY